MGGWGSESWVVQWQEGWVEVPVLILLVHPPNWPMHTHPPSHCPTFFPLITDLFHRLHQNLVQLSQLAPCSKKMLSVISERQPLQGHCDSLVGPRVNKIELVMDYYTR